MRKILGALPLRREIGTHASRVLVQRMASLERRLEAMLAVRATPVVELALLDLRSTPLGESSDMRGIHRGPSITERCAGSRRWCRTRAAGGRPGRPGHTGRSTRGPRYFSSQPNSIRFVVSRETAASESTSGISFGHTSTQFCDLPQSVIPPSLITDSRRSPSCIAPEGCML